MSIVGDVSAFFSKAASVLNNINVAKSIASKINVVRNKKWKALMNNLVKSLRQLFTSSILYEFSIHSFGQNCFLSKSVLLALKFIQKC